MSIEITPEKTAVELSNAFDILYNNINSNKSPGIDEYEKSYFFTKAQDELIKRYAFVHTNALQSGVDGSQKRQIDYSTLITVKELSISTDAFKYSEHAIDIYEFPSDVLFIMNECVYNLVSDGTSGENKYIETTDVRKRRERQIVPITFEQYSNLRLKPFPFPPKNQAWRLLHSKGNKIYSEIISSEIFHVYKIRYIKYPDPIILENWDEEDGRSIRGKNTITLPTVPVQMYEELIQAAVEIAKQAYNSMGPMDIVRFPENQIIGR